MELFYSQVGLTIIPNNYIIIMVIYHAFADYGIPGSNIQHSMLDFCKE